MTELEKLDQYLTEHKYPHVHNCIPYFDADGDLITNESNQIIVYEESDFLSDYHFPCGIHDDNGKIIDKRFCNVCPGGAIIAWDAVCFRGTKGSELGLIEIMCEDRSLITGYLSRAGISVEGNLTAAEIIRRLEAKNEADTED